MIVWKTDLDTGPLASLRPDSEFTADSGNPFLHTDDSERSQIVDSFLGNSLAIIRDRHPQITTVGHEIDLGAGSRSVPDDVRQCFLDHSKERGRRFRTEHHLFRIRLQLTADTGPFLEILDLPLNRREQAKIIENRRAKLRRDSSNALDGLVHVQQHRFHLVSRLRLGAPTTDRV